MRSAATAKKEQLSPLYTVRGVVILDTATGERLAAKYSPWWQGAATVKDQIALERKLHAKTRPGKKGRSGSGSGGVEILMLEDTIVLHRAGTGVRVFVIGAQDENELLLLGVLNTIWDALLTALFPQPGAAGVFAGGALDRQLIVDNFDTVLLVLDEALDDGVVLESDASLVAYRATMRSPDGTSLGEPSHTEETFTQALSFARDSLIKFLR